MSPTKFDQFLASLDPATRRLIDEASQWAEHPTGALLHPPGVPLPNVYVVESGVLQAVAGPQGGASHSLGHLTAGDCCGLISVVGQSPNLATLRVLEAARLRVIPAEKFQRLLLRVPVLGAFVAAQLARRLHEALQAKTEQATRVDLGGSLRHFDLLLIFQTILQNGSTGRLALTSGDGHLLGEFFFRAGSLLRARYAHLEGLQAAWQVFVEAPAGTFAFEALEAAALSPGNSAPLGAMELLMQAAAHRDHFQRLPAELRRQEGALELGPASGTPAAAPGPALDPADEAALAAAAPQVLAFIQKRPQSLASLWRRLALSSYHFALLVQRLTCSGQARHAAADTPAAP